MEIQRVTVIGGGLIGASWAALFLAHGLSVTVQDIDKAAEARVLAQLAAAWPDLQALGLARTTLEAAQAALRVTPDMQAALQGVQFVQECGPDRLPVKREIIAGIEAHVTANVIIASSSSALMASEMQQGAAHPGRILVGHPFNPPHLVPLVELVPGRHTEAETVTTARAFYEGLGREIVVPLRESRGHVANRLTAALYREAVHLVAEGIATVEDVDRAVSAGPGLRWALMGPHLTYHMGGGEGGLRHYLEHLGPAQERRWADLGTPRLDAATVDALVSGLDAALARMDETTLARRRDAALVALVLARRDQGFGA
ncbi:3-hydroxyacyl-CoA dehydrogenase NAD-binding domain-containing protein [Lutimaribacter sp. EGI FJ00015]|uniref:3-hydroxyacyl-CoA dehydrogenase NAD-binding domain-containing protein n=1 Tax=Lutimaribacter degradans TaxID=2945989 RepID=A0ACC5ZV16_9RHOB|nr:3-hydroxyacyl-CoA dehydrogenase NAD-binding domain-containing protein [Lutimaribacter sp. EGI FJ00013]MCM2562193.1 3-hydroxyacyl-CoA dehydrogenase NAD-binding domain-containing protein [Lutimaribacter sp. EGI FJ00013]MCO0613348.1 3-hydroxyacyl-CoA dehydrogenase NAD-binding domain-containing protein [Lutimaribacter sp. EGI FJ00015]MCO0636322.1 3-hydroxyacyl-CoA dehydrogenase NAD-binding domain-containing protein [Lutimaribacter sp. EGI FJ00014]